MRKFVLIVAILLLFPATQNQASSDLSRETLAAAEQARYKLFLDEQDKERDRAERQKQIPAIISIFERHTSKERAHRLAYLSYETTLDTPLKPIDLAEIALAETGGHRLSGHAVSSEGALGVWQLMPERAKSHGYTPAQMKHDERNAEAAVKELMHKLGIAKGDLHKAKKLYCGAGPEAREYVKKIARYRKAIMVKIDQTSNVNIANS